MRVRRPAARRLQADLKSILYAHAGPDFSALRIQPLQTGRNRDFEEAPGAWWSGVARGSPQLCLYERIMPPEGSPV